MKINEERIIKSNIQDKLCIKKNMILIRIKYDEPLTKNNLLKKVKERGIII